MTIRSPHFIGGAGTTSGPPVGGANGLLITEGSITLGITAAESLGAKTATDAFVIRVTNSETLTGSETNRLNLMPVAEANSAQVETRTAFIRYWASASADNDASRTTPANANGANNATFCTVKTNNSVANLTNPVTATSGVFGTPGTGTPTAKRLRIFYKVAAAPILDTVTLTYNIGAGDVAIRTVTAAEDFTATGLTFDISGLTLAQVQALSIKASYTAAVVALPTTSIQVDAWAVELQFTT